jgi:Xaa-Pro dipeptidase
MHHLDNLNSIQEALCSQNLDGWLLYDFRRTNNLACEFLDIPAHKIFSRRFLYWIPAKGEPIKIVHVIEEHSLDHLPGKILSYRSWQELENRIASVLTKSKRVAMEYSPKNAIPYVSKVDAGTIELVRSCGVDVVSSADLLQKYLNVWDAEQLKSHFYAAEVVSSTVQKAWDFIANALKAGKTVSEYTVQQFILEEFDRQGCVSEDAPICAVNANSANPHYCADSETFEFIRQGDFILIDLSCKQKIPKAVFADITRVAVAANKPTAKQQEIFSIVKKARDAGTELVRNRINKSEKLCGYQVDECCRKVITDAGYGDFFLHRTGHNIGEEIHGSGAHLDSLETVDQRELIPGTCFSIEPGIYLPGEFGVRLEYDVYIHLDRKVQVTGGVQVEITTL